jgi:hypothetical protein
VGQRERERGEGEHDRVQRVSAHVLLHPRLQSQPSQSLSPRSVHIRAIGSPIVLQATRAHATSDTVFLTTSHPLPVEGWQLLPVPGPKAPLLDRAAWASRIACSGRIIVLRVVERRVGLCHSHSVALTSFTDLLVPPHNQRKGAVSLVPLTINAHTLSLTVPACTQTHRRTLAKHPSPPYLPSTSASLASSV